MQYDIKKLENKLFSKEYEYNGKQRVITSNSTVLITFYSELGIITKIKEYAFITKEEVYEDIKSGKDICLDFCYIQNISIHNTEICCFSAYNTFFDGDTSFNNVKFKDKGLFSNAIFNSRVNFNESTFCCNVDYDNVSFNEGADFMSVTFDGEVNFSLSIFTEKANFHQSIFDDSTYFSYTVFKKETSFYESIFFGHTIFRNTVFNEEATFWKTIFFGQTDFSYTEFLHDAIFDEAVFEAEGGAFFTACRILGKIKFYKAINKLEIYFDRCVFDEHADMKFQECVSLSFVYCIVEKTIDLSSVKFSSLCLIGTRNLGQIFIDWKENNVKNALYTYVKGKKVSQSTLSKQFLLLKENFNRLGQYDDEDYAYVEFKRCERRANFLGENTETGQLWSLKRVKYLIQRIVAFITNPAKYLILDKIGGYGTKPQNVFFSMILTIFVFTFIYWGFPGLINETRIVEKTYISNNIIKETTVPKFGQAWDSFYHSIITFFTVGYGETLPVSKLGIIVSGCESFIGVFLMSYFTVAFVRKILR